MCAQAISHSPPTALLGSRVRVSVSTCGFNGGRNEIGTFFSGFRFPLQLSFHHFSTLISSVSFHSINLCNDVTGVVDRHPCYSQTFIIGASSLLIPEPGPMWDMSWDFVLSHLILDRVILEVDTHVTFYKQMQGSGVIQQIASVHGTFN